MMFYTTAYEIAKALNDNKVSRSMARNERLKRVVEPTPTAPQNDDAEVVELAFGSHCDEARIGA